MKKALVALIALATMSLSAVSAFAAEAPQGRATSRSANVYFNFVVMRGSTASSSGYKDDYASALVNLNNNPNWQQTSSDRFLLRLYAGSTPASNSYSVISSGRKEYAYYSGYSNPGSRTLKITYPADNSYTDATADGVWAP